MIQLLGIIPSGTVRPPQGDSGEPTKRGPRRRSERIKTRGETKRVVNSTYKDVDGMTRFARLKY